MVKDFLRHIHNFKLLPLFVIISMSIGIDIGKFYSISDFQITPPVDAIKSIFHGTYEFSIANTLALGVVSVLLYLGIPLIAGILTRFLGIKRFGEVWFERLKFYLDTVSIAGLLFTLTVMFALKGDLILEHPLFIVHMAVPITIFFWTMFAAVYLTSWRLGLNYKDSVAVAFNSTGRDFEIAIAMAITAFNPAVALATVIGPLIEVPVMLALVWFAKKTENRLFFDETLGLPGRVKQT